MSFSVRALARRALIAASVGVLALSTVPAVAADSLDELLELNSRAWSGEPELLNQVYAPDGVHTATFYDQTNEYTGPDAIATIAAQGGVNPVAPRIDIPAADGEYRWADFIDLAGGTTCLWRAVDGQITRQDCLLPENSTDSRARAGLAGGSSSAAIDELLERLGAAWGADASIEGLAAAYAPDAVHSARFLSTTRSYKGPEEIAQVALRPVAVEQIGPRVEFEAPEGELAWAAVNNLGGGSVCLFRAVDGMVVRHDCVVPIAG
jgi:hypothetical protein